MFGLWPDDIHRDAMLIRVVRQVQPVKGKLVFCLPKGEKTRDVPFSDRVLRELDAHLEIFPPASVTLPWEEPGGEPTTATLIMTDEARGAWRQWTFNRQYWQPALERAGVTNPTRADGTHALRHYYASALQMSRVASGASFGKICELALPATSPFELDQGQSAIPSSRAS
jgi:integrase